MGQLSAGLRQGIYGEGIPCCGGGDQWGDALVVRQVWICPGSQEHLHHVGLSGSGGSLERRFPMGADGVHLHTGGDEFIHHGGASS